MFWSRRTVEAALSALRAENADLRLQLRSERVEWAEERQQLVDRILALSSPASLREVRRAPLPRGPSPPVLDARPRRLNYPSGSSYLRPPSPPHPPIPGASSPSDADKYAVLLDDEKES
jgi:hypothetical protein